MKEKRSNQLIEKSYYHRQLKELEKRPLIEQMYKPLTMARLKDWLETLYYTRSYNSDLVSEILFKSSIKFLGYESVEEYLNMKEKYGNQ